MNEKLQARVDLFLTNTESIKGSFTWQNSFIKRLAALLFASQDQPIDIQGIRASHDLIKGETSVVSMFRGNSSLTLSALLALSEDREGELARTLLVYEAMKSIKFRASDFLVIAAYFIAVNAREETYGHVIARTKTFYEGMKEQHKFITSADDYIFSALLALSDLEVAGTLQQLEVLHESLKLEYRHGNSIQSLSQVLILSKNTAETLARLRKLRLELKAMGLRMDKEYTLSSMGVLALLPVEEKAICQAIKEVHDCLRQHKAFGKFSVSNQEILILASALVAFDHLDEFKSGIVTAAISTSLLNIIIAEQTAIAVAAAASAAAASGSNG